MFRNRKTQVKIIGVSVGAIVVVIVIVVLADKLKKVATGDVPQGFTAITTGMHTTDSITQVSAQASAQIAVLSNQYQAQMAAYNAKFAELEARREEVGTLEQSRVEKAVTLNAAQETVDALDYQRQAKQAEIDALQRQYNAQGTDLFGILANIVTLGIGPNVIKGDIQAKINAATGQYNALSASLATAINTRDAASKAVANIDKQIAAIEDILGNYAAAFDAIGRVRDGLAIEIQQLGGSVPG